MCTWAEGLKTPTKSLLPILVATSNIQVSGNLCLLLDGESQSEGILTHVQACVGMLMSLFKRKLYYTAPTQKSQTKTKTIKPTALKKTTKKQRKSMIKHTQIENPKPARNKNQSILLPRTTKTKLGMHGALRTFSAWNTYNYDGIILKSQDPFHGFYVTRLFPFIYFCSCYRLQMSDLSPFLTTSNMEIMLQAWETSALTHQHGFLFSPACKREEGQQWETALCCSPWEKINSCTYFERNSEFSHL